ncbi:BTB/POZ and MATH domain-containing protein 3-like [Papaver somniferum]|uniref:BTB/POZ and MATH domain-containing protein 3-like n=1 Tax=Papaver somniferum TaxID=3469 RepID=UPI000E700267|nr:BTB/POZ and MATH domain-containing protein 3-like [Papaver somniferum]
MWTAWCINDFCMRINFRGFQKYRKRSWLETSSYLKDDCLNIHCTIGVVRTRVGNGKRYVIPVPPPEMIQNLKGLLESKIGSDITFQVGNEFFRAHKLIIAARSPVFRAQFFGLVGNPEIEIVVIKELDPFAFKAMLLFLYSDELPETHELSDLDPLCTPITIAQHLLAAADRFGLARLKLMCEEKLYEDITANTVANTLAIADVYNCTALKTVCLNFAARPENLEEVMESDGYADLEKSLLTDLLKTSAAIDKK